MKPKDQKPVETTARVVPGKPFNCKQPGCSSKGFNTIGSKQRHERELHGPDKKCGYCDFTAKRRYQIKDHIEANHPEQIGDTLYTLCRGVHVKVLTTILLADTTIDPSTEQAARSPITSYSSDEASAGVAQHARGPPFQRPSTGQQSFPGYPYDSSNIGVTRQPAGPSYATNMYSAISDSDYPVNVPGPSGQSPSTGIQTSYSTLSQRNSVAQSTTLWGAPLGANAPISSNLPFSTSATMQPPNQVRYALSPGTPYQSQNNYGIHDYTSPYSSTSSEQGTPYNPIGGPYAGETGEENN
jgi:hypothetical protein